MSNKIQAILVCERSSFGQSSRRSKSVFRPLVVKVYYAGLVEAVEDGSRWSRLEPEEIGAKIVGEGNSPPVRRFGDRQLNL